jgi:hypothetical protein
LLRGEPFEHGVSIVDLHLTPVECARQAMARAQADRLRPLVCCGADGRFVGILRVDRLVSALVD